MPDPEKRELRAIREILAVKQNMRETGDFGNYTNLQVEVCVPEEYQYLKDYDVDALKKRQRRLRQDIADRVNLDADDACDFNVEANYRRGKRMGDGGDN